MKFLLQLFKSAACVFLFKNTKKIKFRQIGDQAECKTIQALKTWIFNAQNTLTDDCKLI